MLKRASARCVSAVRRHATTRGMCGRSHGDGGVAGVARGGRVSSRRGEVGGSTSAACGAHAWRACLGGHACARGVFRPRRRGWCLPCALDVGRAGWRGAACWFGVCRRLLRVGWSVWGCAASAVQCGVMCMWWTDVVVGRGRRRRGLWVRAEVRGAIHRRQCSAVCAGRALSHADHAVDSVGHFIAAVQWHHASAHGMQSRSHSDGAMVGVAGGGRVSPWQGEIGQCSFCMRCACLVCLPKWTCERAAVRPGRW